MTNGGEGRERALTGVRVLDFGRVLAAPHCARWMRDMGADVVKLERPVDGDDIRKDPYVYEPGLSAGFMQQNWGKKSVSIDLRRPEARPLIEGLVSKADVVLENFRPGVMDRLGFGYRQLSRINPRLIMCSISAYGQTGPHAQRPGYGKLLEAVAAIAEITGEPDGPPMPTLLPIADNVAAGMALGAIGAALYYRERTGRGQFIDIALLDAAFQCQDFAIQQFLASGGRVRMTRSGVRDAIWVPSGVHKGRDGWVMIKCVENEASWGTLATAMRRPDLIDDPRYSTFERRRERKDEVYALVDEWVATFASVDEIETLLVAAGVPCARVNDVEQAINHPQLRARRMLVERQHPTLGPMLIMNSGFNFSDLAADVVGTAPFLGEHNEEVLRDWLGIPAAEVERLTGAGVLYHDPRLDKRDF